MNDTTGLLDLAARATRRLDETLTAGLAAAGLSPAQGRALRAIAAEPGLTVGGLTERLGISKQSLAPVLKSLIRRGLVTASGADADRRRRLLRLTGAGEAAWATAAGDVLGLLETISAEAGAEAACGFRTVLDRLARDPRRRKTDMAP